jgi:hypothetical protein
MLSSATPSASGTPTGLALPWILRAGVAACFIGHGMLGLLRLTTAWTPYFAVVGIGQEAASSLMPWVGAFDVAMALSVLFCPVRAVVAYMVLWTLWTAFLRPLAGESFWEAVERAGNYGATLALCLLFAGGDGARSWFRGRWRATMDDAQRGEIVWVLRLTTVLLLLGHGGLNCIVQKPAFSAQYSLLGMPGANVELLLGGFECLLALAVLLAPNRRLLLGVVGWKLATEALVPMAGSSWWVFVEHGGSYAAPLALGFLLPTSRAVRTSLEAASAQ